MILWSHIIAITKISCFVKTKWIIIGWMVRFIRKRIIITNEKRTVSRLSYHPLPVLAFRFKSWLGWSLQSKAQDFIRNYVSLEFNTCFFYWKKLFDINHLILNQWNTRFASYKNQWIDFEAAYFLLLWDRFRSIANTLIPRKHDIFHLGMSTLFQTQRLFRYWSSKNRIVQYSF